jgi:prevent-host-death family protein
MQVTIHQAKTQLSKLIAAAERGEEVIIARRDKPVVRMIAEKTKKPSRTLGFLASREVILDGFFDPILDAQIADDFNGFSASNPLHPDHLTNEDHEQGA